MSRPKKEPVNLSINFNKTIAETLDAMSKETGLPKKAIVENTGECKASVWGQSF